MDSGERVGGEGNGDGKEGIDSVKIGREKPGTRYKRKRERRA